MSDRLRYSVLITSSMIFSTSGGASRLPRCLGEPLIVRRRPVHVSIQSDRIWRTFATEGIPGFRYTRLDVESYLGAHGSASPQDEGQPGHRSLMPQIAGNGFRQ